jgi:hypothetical protein
METNKARVLAFRVDKQGKGGNFKDRTQGRQARPGANVIKLFMSVNYGFL